MFACEAVDLDFLDTAPIRLGAAVNVGRPPSEVFAAFAHDPANWGEFFPGFDRSGHYHTSGPHGVGSRCTKRVTGVKVEETVLAWDEAARFAFPERALFGGNECGLTARKPTWSLPCGCRITRPSRG
jgi:hypothetical protein